MFWILVAMVFWLNAIACFLSRWLCAYFGHRMFMARFALVASLRRLVRTQMDLQPLYLVRVHNMLTSKRATNDDVRYVCALKLTADSKYPIQTPLPRSNPIQKPPCTNVRYQEVVNPTHPIPTPSSSPLFSSQRSRDISTLHYPALPSPPSHTPPPIYSFRISPN